MRRIIARVVLSAFCACVAAASFYLAWASAFTAAYASVPALWFAVFLFIAFALLTAVWTVISWARQLKQVRAAYGWSSALVFVLMLVLYAIDGLNLQRIVLVGGIAVVLYLNWQAMRLLHANAT
jgi:hypothetical protein